MKILTSKVPYVGHLRCFGCEVWSFTSKRKKLDSKSRRCILLRSLPHRNYRVWDINSGRLYHVRHVKINETVYPAAELGQENNGALSSWVDKMDDIEYDYVEEGDDSLSVQSRGNDSTNVTGNAAQSNAENLTYHPDPEASHQHSVERRYPLRNRSTPQRYGLATEDSVLLAREKGGWRVPKTLEEARTVSDSREWLAAVNEEIERLQGNKS